MSTRTGDGGWERGTAGDVVATGVLLALLAPFAYRAAAAVPDGHASAVVAATLAGVLVSDLATGCLHWLADTFFRADTPLIGRAVVEPFREHHRDPLAMTRRSFLRVSSSNVVATAALLAALWLWRGIAAPPPSAFGDAFVTSLACAFWLTNQFHTWAHLPRVPRAVAWLQGAGLILSPARHARHHAAPGDRAFCVTTGWLNPVLDRLGAFTVAERLVRAVQRRSEPGSQHETDRDRPGPAGGAGASRA